MSRLRSVLVAEEHPAGAVGGIALRNAAAVHGLVQRSEVVVVGVGDPLGDAPPSRLGEARAVGLGHRPVVRDDWVEHPSEGRWDQDALQRFEELLADVRPDVVVVEQLWLHACLDAARRSGARTVLDAHNVEAQVYAAIAAASGDDRDRRMASATAALEQRVVAQVDQVWACSEQERAVFGPSSVVVPNVVDVAAVAARTRPAAEPVLLYSASFAYPPNTRAARVLVDEVLPAYAAAVPGAQLALVGHSPPRWLRERAAADVLVPGRVASLQPWLERAAAIVVPLTEGGGTRFKVLEAMAAGVPVVSTAKGVEGLDVVDGEHVLLGAAGAELASRAAGLWHDPDGAQALAARARRLVEDRYSWPIAAGRIADALARLR